MPTHRRVRRILSWRVVGRLGHVAGIVRVRLRLDRRHHAIVAARRGNRPPRARRHRCPPRTSKCPAVTPWRAWRPCRDRLRHAVASAASSASCLSTMSSTACMLRSARRSRPLAARALALERLSGLALELREHVLGDQLVAALRRRPGWPTRGRAAGSSRSRRSTASAAARSARTASSAVPIEPSPISLTKSIISRDVVPLADGHLREGGGVLEVVEPLLDAVLDVRGRPARGSRRCASARRGATASRSTVVPNVRGPLLHHVPVQAEHVEAGGLRGADRQQADAVAGRRAAARPARRRRRRRRRTAGWSTAAGAAGRRAGPSGRSRT